MKSKKAQIAPKWWLLSNALRLSSHVIIIFHTFLWHVSLSLRIMCVHIVFKKILYDNNDQTEMEKIPASFFRENENFSLIFCRGKLKYKYILMDCIQSWLITSMTEWPFIWHLSPVLHHFTLTTEFGPIKISKFGDEILLVRQMLLKPKYNEFDLLNHNWFIVYQCTENQAHFELYLR